MARFDDVLPAQPKPYPPQTGQLPQRTVRKPRSRLKTIFVLTASFVLAALYTATYFWAEGLWFQELAFLNEFWLRSRTQVASGLITLLVSLGITFFNLRLADRLQFNQSCLLPTRKNLRRSLGLRGLLLVLIGLGLFIGGLLVYHGSLAVYEITSDRVAIPAPFGLDFQLDAYLLQQLVSDPWLLLLLSGVAVALITLPRLLIRISAVLISTCFAIIAIEEWARLLPSLTPTSFGQTDPVFGQDLSFYIFKLPIWELVNMWLSGLLLFVLAAVLLMYLLAGETLQQGRFVGFSPQQQRHLYAIAASVLLITSLSHWLDRFELLYSGQGVTYGASFTDIHVDLPVNAALSLISLGLALFLAWRTLAWASLRQSLKPFSSAQKQRRRWRHVLFGHPIIIIIFLYFCCAILGNTLVPWFVQRTVVQPNELLREQPYIERTIAFTRKAFGLDDIEIESFNPQGNLTAQNLQQNELTIGNIRLWDTRPLLESNRQLQQIRLYYEFADADVDRYTLIGDDQSSDRRQVLISARELNYEQVPTEAQTWVNEHLIYTHGYGFTMSPVNTAGPSGLPEYFIKDIAHTPSSPDVARSIPVNQPRIYYGELTNTYIMPDSRISELDYPSGGENVYNRYDGQGGINIGPLWRRLLFAKHLRDWRMLLTDDFTPDTRLMFRRNIEARVKRIAPFLEFDDDPYLVIADVEDSYAPVNGGEDENYLYWIIDAYTTSDRYPYSDPDRNRFNYIRNSVKVVVDAYNGSVHFYVADENDPIIRTWSRIFPNMFEPLAAMPNNLLTHIRYPHDFSLIQSDQLFTYHMTDPQVFYNREDLWRAPNEIYANEEQVVKPYYITMELPDGEAGEFVLLRPFTPARRNNLIALLAARSDGDNYGKQLLYEFPKQELVFGPEQIEARINQEPEISQRISLWNTQGSRANQGNLLVIPIDDSVLYVEPLYLEAEQNRLPILARVIVAYKNRIAMAQTLEQGLSAIFEGANDNGSAIIQEVEDTSGVEELLLPNSEDPALSVSPEVSPD
ncbi:MAG: UPF0182 family protein [Cyanobacteria bacterium P01_D01_bin.105]